MRGSPIPLTTPLMRTIPKSMSGVALIGLSASLSWAMPQGVREPAVASRPLASTPLFALQDHSPLAQSTTYTAPLGTRPRILLTGYWPPSNEALRRFSPNPAQNPQGWIGSDWEGRGYDIYAYFPEFTPADCSSCGQGMGDLEVDYQDTTADFWGFANFLAPEAIITFSRGGIDMSWEVEMNQINRSVWFQDYTPPRMPTPTPPDASVPAGTFRYSSLPVERIVQAVDQANLGLDPEVCFSGNGGGFLSEFIAYNGVWYKELHDAPGHPTPCYAAGHVHVGGLIDWNTARLAAEITLRETIAKVDCARSGSPCDTFCDPMDPNSTGASTQISGVWTAVGFTGMHLEATSGPPGEFGYFLIGSGRDFQGVAVSQGRLCLSTAAGETIGRYNVAGTVMQSLGQFDNSGTLVNMSGTSHFGTGFDVPYAIPNQANTIQTGETWHFQLWHRESGGASNFSNGLSVVF